MSNGVLCFANNNNEIDYIKQAEKLAFRVKKYLNLPTSVVTATPNLADNKIFDSVIESNTLTENYKRYHDGDISYRNLIFNNFGRHNALQLSPYDKTIVLDTDYIICNDVFKVAFEQPNDFLIYKNGIDLAGWRHHPEFDYINDKGIPFYWATAFYFEKTENVKIFFDLLNILIKNWDYYKTVFDIGARNFRNDHAFSMAIHYMNGLTDSDWAKPMPGNMYYTLDRDRLNEIKDDVLQFLLAKENKNGEFIFAKTKGQNVHVMNKFSLERCYE